VAKELPPQKLRLRRGKSWNSWFSRSYCRLH